MGNPLRRTDFEGTGIGAAGSADFNVVHDAEIHGWLVAVYLDVPGTLSSNGGTLVLYTNTDHHLMLLHTWTNVRAGVNNSEGWDFPRIPVTSTLPLAEKYPLYGQLSLALTDGSPVLYRVSVIYEEVPF